jgi:predicted DCC family thiol-disulfide oxidoreductase YuxK
VSEAPLLVFDGDCAFCSSTVWWAQRHIRRLPPCAPYQSADLASLGLTAEQCEAAIQFVAADGRLFSAHDAVAEVLRRAGKGWWLLGSLLRMPGVHGLGGVMYRWIARNRHRLPGGTPACSLNNR